MDRRPSLDDIFMEIAEIWAKRSSCLRRNVGAVLVRDKRILSSGYNGAPAGVKSCLETNKCLREGLKSGEELANCWACHAEQNAIVNAAYHGISTKGAIMYCNVKPCNFCAKMIINAGIIEIVYKEYYEDKMADEMFQQAGIICRKFLSSSALNNRKP